MEIRTNKSFLGNYNEDVVYVTHSPDYEGKQQHQLITLTATDSVAGGYTATILLINVLDVNDCSPEFVQKSYSIAISEAMPLGSIILQVVVKE
jgi:hypothetical protein